MNRSLTFGLFVLLAVCILPASGQTNKKIKALQSQKKELQKGLERSKKELAVTKKTVAAKMRDIDLLSNQVATRQRYIDTMEVELKAVESRVDTLQQEVDRTEVELQTKKKSYAKALRYERTCKSVNSPMLFVLSTNSARQMFRRSRYAGEYANYQRTLGEQFKRCY